MFCGSVYAEFIMDVTVLPSNTFKFIEALFSLKSIDSSKESYTPKVRLFEKVFSPTKTYFILLFTKFNTSTPVTLDKSNVAGIVELYKSNFFIFPPKLNPGIV